MKRYLLLLLLPALLYSCKKDTRASPLTGTWKETAIVNIAYNAANVAVSADTIPVLTSGGAYYTDFMNNGQFASYTLNGNTKTEVLDGTYAYNDAAKTLNQTWQLSTGNYGSNIGRVRASASFNGSNGYTYNVASFNGNMLTLSVKIPDNVYGAYDGPQNTAAGYTIQTRRLTRN